MAKMGPTGLMVFCVLSSFLARLKNSSSHLPPGGEDGSKFCFELGVSTHCPRMVRSSQAASACGSAQPLWPLGAASPRFLRRTELSITASQPSFPQD